MISPDGIVFIKDQEALRLTAYKPTPADVFTIGYGHTNGVYQGQVITPFEADQMLKDDLYRVNRCIPNTVFIELEQCQFDALGSLIFNVGVMAWTNSIARKCLNESALDEFSYEAFGPAGWIHDHSGSVLPGLVARRQREQALFFNGQYGGIA